MAQIQHPECMALFRIPKKRGSAQGVDLVMQRGTAEFFGFWSITRAETSPWAPADGGRAYLPTYSPQRSLYRYRIAYPDPNHPRGIRRARFRLEKSHTQATLQVITDHLNAVQAPWLWLCDDNGARLHGGLFHSDRISHAA